MTAQAGTAATALEEHRKLLLDVLALQDRIDNLTERMELWTVRHSDKEEAYRDTLAGKLNAIEDHLYALDAKLRRLE